MIYIVEGTGPLTVDGDTSAFDVGSLAYFRGDEELDSPIPAQPDAPHSRSRPHRIPQLTWPPAATRHDPYTA